MYEPVAYLTVLVNASSVRIQSDHSTSCVSLLMKLCLLTFVSNLIALCRYDRVHLLEQRDWHDFDCFYLIWHVVSVDCINNWLCLTELTNNELGPFDLQQFLLNLVTSVSLAFDALK